MEALAPLPSRLSLFGDLIPDVFSGVMFDAKDEVSKHAKTFFVVDDNNWAMYTGLLRAKVAQQEERDNYAFLHSKEIASRPSTKYSLNNIREDLHKRGIAVFMNQGWN